MTAVAALAHMADQGCIRPHLAPAVPGTLRKPDRMVFDLDAWLGIGRLPPFARALAEKVAACIRRSPPPNSARRGGATGF
ncbi:MAG: hypothetical protein ACQEVT_09100 [Pseudomonadota bacterium]|uniref:hypothetical protein n=1 Tax=Roseovarius TaxID=74030 RepID=UPI0022A827B3|nr:hypothetical protein [Roseovarius sp. EGI FJ00037]MCZ0813047.1 hypothetical protein [Roseovarius sp. EGI FJ00037]